MVDVGWAELMHEAIGDLPAPDWRNFCDLIQTGMKNKADIDTILELFIRQGRIIPISINEVTDKKLRTFTQLCGLISENNAKSILNWFRFCYKIPELK
jgi:hypothetical protein